MEKNRTLTWDQQVIKKRNKSLVLETIMKYAPISRASIANQTGLNKGTVSSLVHELIRDQLIFESGLGKSSGGRRPVMLLFNKDAGYSIGINLGVNYLLGILTNLDGEICERVFIEYKNREFKTILKKLYDVIDHLIASVPRSPYGIIGIGIGVPGVVNHFGEILLAPNLSWENIHLRSMIEKRYDLPVYIENEANAGAYGEKKFGVGIHDENIIYVSAGMGIGVGIILHGRLYKGTWGYSGELGHMTIKVDGRTCSCGNRGCWEIYASEQTLLYEAKQNGRLDPEKETDIIDFLCKRSLNNDQEAIHLFSKVGKYLGIGINNIIHAFNPDQIIIGNRLASAEQWIKPALIESIENQSMWFLKDRLKITFSKLEKYSIPLGLVAVAIEQFIQTSIKQSAS